MAGPEPKQEPEWVTKMQEKLDDLPSDQSQEGQSEQSGRTKPFIHKVPPFMLKVNVEAYKPQVVSFGPYRHKEPDVAWMEAHKERALLRWTKRSRLTVRLVFDLVMNMAQDLKDWYESLDSDEWENGGKESFVQLMMLDGCFMLELLYLYRRTEEFPNNDRIFSSHGKMYIKPFIKTDMLLLENQLPMLLLCELEGISENTETKRSIRTLNEDILMLYDFDIGEYSGMLDAFDIIEYSEGVHCLHVLDLYRKCLLRPDYEPGNANPQSPNQGDEMNRVDHNVVHIVHPAIELHEAGVRFMKSESKSLRSITFKDGVLKLPKFIVADHIESRLLNLIAFERCDISAGNDIISFVAFMDLIINDSQDIKLLRSREIIDNFIGSDKAAADLFNKMSKNLPLDLDCKHEQVYKDLIIYCNRPWPKWRANLTQTYLKSPWAIISLFAAFLLFSLAAVQTIFTILH